MKQKYYYKVVTKDMKSSNAGFSWLTNLFKRNFILKYAIEKRTVPKIKNTKLYVFKNLQEARNSNIGGLYSKVLRCVVENPQKMNAILFPDYINEYIVRYPKNRKALYLAMSINDINKVRRLPHSMNHSKINAMLLSSFDIIGCDSVTPIKEISRG